MNKSSDGMKRKGYAVDGRGGITTGSLPFSPTPLTDGVRKRLSNNRNDSNHSLHRHDGGHGLTQQTDSTDRHHRQTDRQTDRQTEKHAGKKDAKNTADTAARKNKQKP